MPDLNADGAGRDGRPDIDFATALAGARNGASWAVTQLYREYNPRLVRYLSAGGSTSGAKLASDVWLTVAQELSSFSGNEPGFRLWLFTIARDLLSDHAARSKRADPITRRGQPERLERHDAGGMTGGMDPARSAIDCLVGELPSSQAEVVLLRVVAGLDVAAVATVLGRSAEWVQEMQQLALQQLARRPLSGERETR